MKLVRLNPKLWTLSAHTMGDLKITHTPQELPSALADELLALRHKGIPLVAVEEMPESDPEPLWSSFDSSDSDEEDVADEDE